MPPSSIIFNAFYSLLALLSIALIAREGVSRLGAGPVRFRLGIASRADSRQGSAAHLSGWTLTFCGLLFLFPIFRVYPDSWQHFMPWLWPFLWLCVCTLSLGSPRRDAKSWLVLAAGLLSLVNGAALLAVGLRILRAIANPPDQLPRALLLVGSVIFFVMGAAALQESISGTLVRERGIQMFGTTQPWSRILVKDWQAREGGFDLHLTVLPPRLFGMSVERDSEIIVPVPASERPALDVFLAGHTATPG